MLTKSEGGCGWLALAWREAYLSVTDAREPMILLLRWAGLPPRLSGARNQAKHWPSWPSEQIRPGKACRVNTDFKKNLAWEHPCTFRESVIFSLGSAQPASHKPMLGATPGTYHLISERIWHPSDQKQSSHHSCVTMVRQGFGIPKGSEFIRNHCSVSLQKSMYTLHITSMISRNFLGSG